LVPIAGLVVGAVTGSVLALRGGTQSAAEAVVEAPVAQPEPAEPTSEATPIETPPTRLPPRWLPARTQLVFSLRLSETAANPDIERAIGWAGPVWQSTVGRVMETFRLQARNLRRLTWAATDLAAWHDQAVVLLEFEEGQDVGIFRGLGEEVDLAVAGFKCRRLAKGSWSQPFAAVDERTVVTGPEALLRELAERSEPHLQSRPLERLLKGTTLDEDFLLFVDLSAARQAGWRLPVSAMDVWPAGREAWHVVWEVPEGLGLLLRKSGRVRSDVALACEGESAAQRVHAALEKLVPAGCDALDGLARSLTAKLQAGRITSEEADRYEGLLTEGKTALVAARREVVQETVWVRIECRGGLEVAQAAMDSQKAIRADWLEAARRGDEANHRRILAALGGYLKAVGHFPPGAGGGALLPPETRLSWIAAMLPYFDHRDWHRDLQWGYPWNNPQNRPVTRRPLDEVINPALGPSTTEAGYPVTHYVGVAGVGENAGTLRPDEPGAGLFGYNRAARPSDVPDGAANTLAILGVTERLGPWAAGGHATVRSLSKRPYVNGPDGFGSGQPDGMLAGMADGSVRFLSKNVAPEVLEQLATLAGGEKIEPAAAPEPAKPGRGKASEGAAKKVAEKRDTEEEGADEPSAEKEEPSAEIDVDARLADRIPEIALREVPLADAVRLVGRMSTLRVTFDLEAMAALGVAPREPVSVQLSGASVKQVLDGIASSRGLACVVIEDQVLLTSPEAKRTVLREVRYDVADLAGSSSPTATELLEWITKLIAPDSWRQAGGPGNARAADGSLTVDQVELVHSQIRGLLEKLRVARRLSSQGENGSSKGGLATHFDLARAKLRQVVTANFFAKTPLLDILADLERTTQSTILIDWINLENEGVSPDLKATLSVHNQRLSEALVALLHPLGLSYRIVGADTFELTTRKAFTARLEVEFYPVAHLLAKGYTPAGLIDRIKGQVAGATWNDAGGPGVLYFDKPSGYLIVLQSQPVQVKLEILLAELAAEGADKGPAAEGGTGDRR